MRVIDDLAAKFFDSTTKRYALVGLAVTLASYAFLLCAVMVFGLSNAAANFAALVFGLTLSYVLNRTYSFRYQGPQASSVGRFAVVVAAAYGANLLVLHALLAGSTVPDAVAQCLAFGTYSVVAYVLHRSWTFGRRKS